MAPVGISSLSMLRNTSKNQNEEKKQRKMPRDLIKYRQWHLDNKEKILQYQREYYKKNVERISQLVHIWRDENRERYRQNIRKYKAEIRLKNISHYSKGKNECACCGEKNIKFLSIDHINGNGSKHQRENHIPNLSMWLYKNNFPEGFQILCYNCNQGKYTNGGICPHKEQVINSQDTN